MSRWATAWGAVDQVRDGRGAPAAFQRLAARARSRAWLIALLGATVLVALPAWGQSAPAAGPTMTIALPGADNPAALSTGLKILALLTVLTLAPAILVMVTSFTRIVIVLSFFRQALGTQSMPPNQVVIGLALFLSAFVMMPTWNQIQTDAITPYLAQQIDQPEAFSRALAPLRHFMLKQTREKDLALFVSFAQDHKPATVNDVPTSALIPAFVISELRTAFEIGFLIYIPFLILDMVVASVLLSMGMMMLPPVLISLPFKLLLFVLVDGWYLLVGSLVKSF
ncbi:MAG: flagellar biosynthetic protein FliP [Nitrospirae bacterium CG18_big_fil_WC_8_21_14_2_50_70_55]|nr:flagellar type III secretion system pore protein FliP [Deltaproteobacteria bacterium]PIQ03484.1 MAG: flagellar biosynthetic protein FliP [Nitrospirae bacterium CG18_big_fil_WC_8_21_14_2_50_70_55]PIU77567.1 MAG: flagellar biosynthetic protein FliP [Nitrospirae bacterium CG06_land_8_20_14_3_00_70_43]PIW82305.1 MAG: flagellar biosynthetic protein FliP [Nitrospirae bacterium CG_4_8_14_3_um_filter_70_85]PIX82680.1 MAG: flagellar biosynthetic protein FliP [Nitrospirae bacterium CG_4_10_14_3_um_fil